MWDPRQYVDTDFGLEDEETFEPGDDEDATYGTRTPHVMTAFGAILPDELGVAFMGEHLLYDVDGIPAGERLDDLIAAIREVTAYVTSGARALVDIATRETGRDVVGLVDIARRVPAHIIVATGGDPAMIEREAREGIGPRKVKPGVALVTTSGELAAARAAGLPTIVRRASDLPGDASTIALAIGVDADRADIDSWPGFLIVSLEGRPERLSEFAATVRYAMETGCGDRTMVAMGWERRGQWHAHGGRPGLAFGMERIPLALMEAGLSADEVRSVLVTAPARFLTVRPSQVGRR